MPGKDLVNTQRLTLLALMVKATPLTRSFLVDTAKIGLSKSERNDLVNRKFISVLEKPITLELTEDGWARAIKELDSDAPLGVGALNGMLRLLLDFLRDHLARNDLSAAELFAAHLPPRMELDVSAAIRKTYAEIAPTPGAYVMLEDLRSGLPDVSSEEFDAALRQMDTEPDVHLVPESNQKVLTPGQRSAAFRIGGQQMHQLSIQV
jgi:hypothetical protein